MPIPWTKASIAMATRPDIPSPLSAGAGLEFAEQLQTWVQQSIFGSVASSPPRPSPHWSGVGVEYAERVADWVETLAPSVAGDRPDPPSVIHAGAGLAYADSLTDWVQTAIDAANVPSEPEYATITYIGAGSVDNASSPWLGGPENLTPTLPALSQVGDCLLCVIGIDWGNNTTAIGTITNMTGWDLIAEGIGSTTPNVDNGPRLYIYRRVRQEGDAAPTPTVTGGAVGSPAPNDLTGGAQVLAFRGTEGEVDVLGANYGPTGAAANIGPVPGVTPSMDGTVVLVAGVRSTNAGGATAPAGFTEAIDMPMFGEAGAFLTLDYQIQTDATPVADTTITVTGGSGGGRAGRMVALKPAQTGGGDGVNWQETLGDSAINLAEQLIALTSSSSDGSASIYHDGTKWRSPLTDTYLSTRGFDSCNVQGMGTLCAIVARFHGYGEGNQYVELAKKSVQEYLDMVDAPTSDRVPEGDFTLSQWGMMLVFLRGLVDAGWWESARDQFLASLLFSLEGGAWSGNINGFPYYTPAGPEENYYINGNREAGELVALEAAVLLSDEDADWIERRDHQRDFTFDPPNNANGTPGGSDGRGYGWTTDGLGGWLRENGGTTPPFHAFANTALDVDGFDHGYAEIQQLYLSMAMTLSGDVEFYAPYLVQMIPKLESFKDPVTFIVNADLASRKPNDYVLMAQTKAILTALGERDDSASDLYYAFTILYQQKLAGYANAVEIYYRAAPMDIGQVIMLHPDWPGLD